jgi:hypothetical protein
MKHGFLARRINREGHWLKRPVSLPAFRSSVTLDVWQEHVIARGFLIVNRFFHACNTARPAKSRGTLRDFEGVPGSYDHPQRGGRCLAADLGMMA